MPTTQGNKVKKAPPKLVDIVDNQGEAAWRSHQKKQDSVRISQELVLQQAHHEILAREHGAFIFSKDGSGTFGIWGDPAAVSATKAAILRWIEDSVQPQKARGAASFAKIASLTPTQREREEKRWKREVMRQRFRQNPPPMMAFHAIGSFLWPVEEYRPEEILGANYEALDPIRMDCLCYVVFCRERNAFRIMGKSEDVATGLLRMRKTCYQIAARQIPEVRMYLLHWGDVAICPHVVLQTYALPVIQARDRTIESPVSTSPRGKGMSSCKNDQSLARTSASHATLRAQILRVLKRLQWYFGSIQMRVRLGVFLMTQYKPPADNRYKLAEFEKMTTQSQFRGRVTQEIGDEAIEKSALRTLHHATELLMPSDALTQTLGEVKPSYTTIFTFADPAGDLRLSVSWHEASDGSIDRESNSGRWTRVDRDRFDHDSETEIPLLDISLTDLSSSSAWQFDILASQAVSDQRLPPALQNFAAKLKPDPIAILSQSTERSFVLPPPTPNLKATQQRVNYRYTLANTDYVLALSRCQDRIYSHHHRRPGQALIGSTSEPIVYEPRWCLSVFRNEWDVFFADNARLSVGAGAAWGDASEESWFPRELGPDVPEDGDGFAQLMEKLKAVETVVRGAQVAEAVDLLTGMSMG